LCSLHSAHANLTIKMQLCTLQLSSSVWSTSAPVVATVSATTSLLHRTSSSASAQRNTR
jgi:hypothetical protein